MGAPMHVQTYTRRSAFYSEYCWKYSISLTTTLTQMPVVRTSYFMYHWLPVGPGKSSLSAHLFTDMHTSPYIENLPEDTTHVCEGRVC